MGIILNSAVLLIAGRQSKRSDMITRKKWKTTFHLPKKIQPQCQNLQFFGNDTDPRLSFPLKKSKMCADVYALFSAVT